MPIGNEGNDPDNILLEPAPFTRDDWKEAVQPYAPGGGDVFSLESSEAVLVGFIPFAKRWSFVRYVLGTATVNWEDNGAGGRTYFLSRSPAAEHPWFGWMTAHSLHMQYFALDGTELKINAFDPELSFDFANYVKCQATIRYKQLPWEWKADDDVTYEYERMTWDPDRQGNLEIISRPSDKPLRYAETSATGPRIGPGGDAFPGEVGLPIYKEQFNFRWQYVPRTWVMSGPETAVGSGIFTDGYMAKKIMPRMATLNDDTFLGFPRGTLILAGVMYERFLWPLRTIDDSPYGYNITFNFQAFDPTKGTPLSTFHGHNLEPWYGDGKYYYCTYDGLTTGQPFLTYTDFKQLFAYVDS